MIDEIGTGSRYFRAADENRSLIRKEIRDDLAEFRFIADLWSRADPNGNGLIQSQGRGWRFVRGRLAPSFVLVRGLPRSRALFSQLYQAKARSHRRKLSEVTEFSRMNGISTGLASCRDR